MDNNALGLDAAHLSSILNQSFKILGSLTPTGEGKTFLVEQTDGARAGMQAVIQRRSQPHPNLPLWLEALRSCTQQTHLPSILTVAASDSQLYLLESWIEGVNFDRVLGQPAPFSERQIWEFLAQALPILKTLHQQGLIHGDIKPSNFVAQASTQALYLVDLGSIQPHHYPVGVAGSPEYAAPEHLQGWIDYASDLYSLGLVCLSLLKGASPFTWPEPSNPAAYCFTDLPDPPSHALQTLLTKLTAHAMGDRYGSVDEVLKEMQRSGATVRQQSASAQIHSDQMNAQQSWVCTRILKGASTALTSVVMHPQGKWAFSGSEGRHILVWDVQTGTLKRTLSAHRNSVTTLSLSPDGQYLAAGSDDKTISLWQFGPTLANLQLLGTLSGHTHSIKAVTFSPDGQTIASGSWDKTVRLWDLKTQKLLKTYMGHRLGINAIVFCPQGHWIASGGLEGEVLLWPLLELEATPFTRLTGHSSGIVSLACSPNGRSIAAGNGDGTLCLWELTSDLLPQLNALQVLSAHAWQVSSLGFWTDGDRLLSGSWDHTIKCWDTIKGHAIAVLEGHTDSITGLALHGLGPCFLSSSRDQTLRVWQQSN